jgi:hypothetical protein
MISIKFLNIVNGHTKNEHTSLTFCLGLFEKGEASFFSNALRSYLLSSTFREDFSVYIELLINNLTIVISSENKGKTLNLLSNLEKSVFGYLSSEIYPFYFLKKEPIYIECRAKGPKILKTSDIILPKNLSCLRPDTELIYLDNDENLFFHFFLKPKFYIDNSIQLTSISSFLDSSNLSNFLNNINFFESHYNLQNQNEDLDLKKFENKSLFSQITTRIEDTGSGFVIYFTIWMKGSSNLNSDIVMYLKFAIYNMALKNLEFLC